MMKDEKDQKETLLNFNNDLYERNMYIPEECLDLIPDKSEREKKRLINILNRLKRELNTNDANNIADVYKDYSEKEKNNKIIKKDINKCVFWLMCIFLFPLFAITYLIGIFLVISIKDILFKLFFSSLKCKVEIGCDLKSFEELTFFYSYFIKNFSKESLDFNLMMFWTFIGIKCFPSLGFRKTTAVFLILNSLMIFLVYVVDFRNYDPISKKYSYSKIIVIFFLWLIMGFTLGSSTLLSQQALVNFYSLMFKEDSSSNENIIQEEQLKKEEKIEEKEENEDKELKEIEMGELNDVEKDNSEDLDKTKNLKSFRQKLRQKLIKDVRWDKKFKINKILRIKASYKKIKDKKYSNPKIERKTSKEIKKQFNSFWIVSIITLLGYLGKYGISIGFFNLKRKNDEKYFQNDNATDYNNTNHTNINEFVFSLNNESITPIINESYYYIIDEYDKDLFFYICIIYFISISLSIGIYSIFKCCVITKKETDILPNIINEKNSSKSKKNLQKLAQINVLNVVAFINFFSNYVIV